jgi:NTE family protein
MRRPRVEIKSVNLALQGGGAQGAFTWGVLDRLLEDERIAFARRAQGQLTRRCSPAV